VDREDDRSRITSWRAGNAELDQCTGYALTSATHRYTDSGHLPATRIDPFQRDHPDETTIVLGDEGPKVSIGVSEDLWKLLPEHSMNKPDVRRITLRSAPEFLQALHIARQEGAGRALLIAFALLTLSEALLHLLDDLPASRSHGHGLQVWSGREVAEVVFVFLVLALDGLAGFCHGGTVAVERSLRKGRDPPSAARAPRAHPADGVLALLPTLETMIDTWAERAHDAMIDGFLAPFLHWPGTRVSLEDGLMLISGPSQLWWFNVVFSLRTAVPGETALARARGFFGDGQHFQVIAQHGVDDDLAAACSTAGMHKVDAAAPHMVVTEPLEPVDEPAWLSIDSEPTAELVRDFARISAEGFATNAETHSQILELLDNPAIFSPINQVFVARVDGQPAGAAAYWMTRGMAGIYWVATMPEHRRKGIASALVTRATNAAFANGAAAATLQASEDGRPVYERLGFTTVATYDAFATTT